MPFELFVALRYLRAKRRQTLVSVISAISVLGIAAGVMALVIALALSTGFKEEIQDKIVGATSHVNLLHLDNAPIADYEALLRRLERTAHVTGSARRADQVPALRQLGAHDVVVGDEIPASPKYDLVIESVGGRTLGTALAALERGGVCVTLGVSASAEVTFDARQFFVSGRTMLYGYYLFTVLGSEPASVGLRRLADLVAAGQLAPHVSLERPWAEIGQVAQDLMARRFPGKAVLTLD